MADDILGGLNAVNQPMEEAPAMEEASVAKEQTEEALYRGDSTERLRKQRLAYDQHLQKMIESFKGRTGNLGYDPKMLALSKGFLTPGKTGNFFESLGTAVGGYGEAAQEEQKLKLEDELTREKLLGLQLGQTEKDYALEKELAGQKYLKDIAAKRYKQSPTQVAVTDVNGMPSARQILSGGSGSRGLITQEDIDLAPPSARKQLLENYKIQQEDIKISQEGAKGVEVELPFIGTRKVSNKFSQEIDMIVNSPQYQALPRETKKALMQQHYSDYLEGIEPPTTNKVAGAPDKGMETTTERELRKKTEEVQATEDIKASKDVQKKDIETITKEIKSAKLQEIAARDMFTYANDPALDKMFGILNSKPGYTSAFFLALKEPVRIGNTSIGVGQIEDILRLANVKDPAVIAAAERFKGLSKQIEANETRILLGGEGQITEGERRIVTTIVPTLSDPKEVVKAKAELTIARAQFDQARAQAFNAYIRQNKNATYFDFENNPESPYQKLWQNYKDHTADIADSYSTSGAKTKRDSSATSAKSTSPVKSGGLWEAIQRSKEAE